MIEKVINRREIDKLLGELIKTYEVIAPVKEDDLLLFKPVEKVEDVLWDYTNTLLPVKGFFFPQREVLFFYDEGELKPAPPLERERILWGIRPCEAKGLLLLDKVFDGEYKDPHFIERRAKTLLVGIACDRPEEACFCSSLDGGPHSTEGLDILLTQLEDEIYFVQILTPKGEKIWGSYGRDGTDEDREKREARQREAEDKFVKSLIPPEDLESVFEDPYWEEVSRKCIGCGICTYLCPTCHCFDIADEEGERVRFWDSCSFPLFTKQASGENPREDKKSRYRQRVYHKFCYSKRNLGEILCVGCGRCIRKCPVKMDIVEIINNVKKVGS